MKQTKIEQAAQKVKDAYLIEGIDPVYHNQQKDHLKKYWKPLDDAVNELISAMSEDSGSEQPADTDTIVGDRNGTPLQTQDVVLIEGIITDLNDTSIVVFPTGAGNETSIEIESSKVLLYSRPA